MNSYNPIDSLGIYYNDDKTQVIGFWKVSEYRRHYTNARKDHFVEICTFPINSQFQNQLLAAVKQRMQEINSLTA